jgi:hypothetical protein
LPYSKRAALKKFQMVQTASCRLHEAFSRACTAHQEHLAKFCLKAKCEELALKSVALRFASVLAYAPTPSTEEPTILDSAYSSGAKTSASPHSEEARVTRKTETLSSVASEWVTRFK